MKKLCMVICIMLMVGCSNFDNIKVEDIDNVEKRLQQLALTLGYVDDLDTIIDLLAKAKLAFDAEDKIKAKEYNDAALLMINVLEGK